MARNAPETAEERAQFAHRLRHERARNGWTQKDLLRAIKDEKGEKLISLRTLQNWEEGLRMPRLGLGIRVTAEVLRVDLGYLLFGEEGRK